MYDPIALTLSTLSILVIIGVIIAIWMKSVKRNDIYNRDMSDIVDQINNSHYYAYTFDKNQEGNIKNLENNIVIVDNKIKMVTSSVDRVSKDFDTIKDTYVAKSALSRGVQTDTLTAKDKLCIQNVCLNEAQLQKLAKMVA